MILNQSGHPLHDRWVAGLCGWETSLCLEWKTMEERPVKMVMVIRKDLHMRRGKEIAQGAHAAMAWLSRRLAWDEGVATPEVSCFSAPERQWLGGEFTKIVCVVDSLGELHEVLAAARLAAVEAHEMVDSGHTEFRMVPTVTCIAIGPDYADRIDPITQHLKLY
jgi:PTH2 family peptidyl-tRNA hydrolase